jgi:hypothetical protein
MIKKLLFVLSSSMTVFAVQAQSVANDSNIAGFGVRFGIYNSTLTNRTPSAGSNLNGNGRIGAILYTLSYDLITSDHFIIGGQFRYNSFLLGTDTSLAQTNVAYSLELDIDPTYHFTVNKNIDLYIQALIGGAFVKLANTNYQESYTAEGFSFGLELGVRFFTHDHFGAQLNLAYSGYEYPDGNISPVNGYLEQYSFFLTGATFGIGLCYKF